MQRLLRRAGRPSWGAAQVLEVNAEHPWILSLAARASAGEALKEESRLLLDLALVQEGDAPRAPAAFIRRVVDVITASTKAPGPIAESDEH
jgi:molecular chaperone HtpG